MPGGYLYGFYTAPGGDPVPVKVACDADGNLKMSVENFDEKARAAINDIFDSSGIGTINQNFGAFQLLNASHLQFTGLAPAPSKGWLWSRCAQADLVFYHVNAAGLSVPSFIRIYDGAGYALVCTEDVADTKIETHRAIPAAHHAKYTDLEAQTACNLNGNLYWSCSGTNFDASEPDVKDVTKNHLGTIVANADGITFVCSVNLPNGATVTLVILYGNDAASAEVWNLSLIRLSNANVSDMAQANINTEDTSISNAVIDNSNFAYFFYTSTLDTDDAIHGALITYTL